MGIRKRVAARGSAPTFARSVHVRNRLETEREGARPPGGRAEFPLRIWKMSGAGNDFIVLPLAPESLPQDPGSFVKSACRRGLSVGADGVLFVTPRPEPPADAALAHFNADGGRSEFCGNGTRCAARFAVLMGFATSPLVLRTDAGNVRAEVEGERVRIDVPPPSVPVRRTLGLGEREFTGWYVVAGVPHFVVEVEDPAAVDLPALGGALRSHPGLGPAGANVDFVGKPSRGRIAIRTFERGVEGETLACGSGAIAAAAVLAGAGARSPLVLTPPSGVDLKVEFGTGHGGPEGFRLTGEARIVFEGLLDREGLASGEGH